jgi:hypothetical protein
MTGTIDMRDSKYRREEWGWFAADQLTWLSDDYELEDKWRGERRRHADQD